MSFLRVELSSCSTNPVFEALARKNGAENRQPRLRPTKIATTTAAATATMAPVVMPAIAAAESRLFAQLGEESSNESDVPTTSCWAVHGPHGSG